MLKLSVTLLLLAGFQHLTLCRGWLSARNAPCRLVSVVQPSSGNYIGRIDSLAGSDLRSKSTLKMSSSPQQFNRGSRPTTPPPPMNQFIRADRVRLLVPGNDTGDEVMLGIFSLADALLEAEKYQMDLVMINDKGDPPVCKVIDYGKYKYSLEKKKKENMKKQVNVDIKEVKMSYKIDQHDFDVRMRAVKKFLGEGDKVNITTLGYRYCSWLVGLENYLLRTCVMRHFEVRFAFRKWHVLY